jgi:thymidine kinase
MAKKLYFRYGAMSSSKSANALMIKHNYEERGLNVCLLKPSIDDRDGVSSVSSRIGINSEATNVYPDSDIKAIVGSKDDEVNISCVLVDEAQFLTKSNVEDLCYIVDEMNIPVICYGLRTDFQGNLFEGSKWLLAWADTIEEIKTICWCEGKATMNMRKQDGTPIFSGSQVFLGGNDVYESVCRQHFNREKNK